MEWNVHGRRRVYGSDWVNVWLDDVEIPGGRRFEHHVLRMPRGSVTVVVTRGTEILLLWRHRFITDTWGWEVPAGWLDDGDSPADAARREVEEETGWVPGPLTELHSYYTVPGLADHRFTIFRADGATYRGAPPDPSESSRVEWVAASDIPKLIEEGQLTDGPSVTALSFALAFLPDLQT